MSLIRVVMAGYDAEQIEDLVERWGINLFILGHERADNGVKFIPPCAIVLNSDHERGVYLPIDLAHRPAPRKRWGWWCRSPGSPHSRFCSRRCRDLTAGPIAP